MLIVACAFLGSCIDKEREKALADREKNLAEKEALFSTKEHEYKSLLKMRDSLLAKKDSTSIQKWPEEIVGLWSGKTICTESNCTEYVIGDVRSETWDFTQDQDHLLVKVLNNGQLIRMYAASYDNNLIQLSYESNPEGQKAVKMSLVLDDIKATKIKGTRSVTINDNCIASFSVELTRSSK